MTFDPVMASLGRYLRGLDEQEAFADALEAKITEVLADASLMADLRENDYPPSHLNDIVERIARDRLYTEARRAAEAWAADEHQRRLDSDDNDS